MSSSEWKVVKLGDVAEVKGGKRLPKGINLVKEKNEHPYIRVRDLGENKNLYLNDDIEYVDDETQKLISKYIVNTNDIIISIVGTIGLVSKIDRSLNNANLTENCVKVINLYGIYHDYLYYYLISEKGQFEIFKGTVGAVQPKLPIKNIQAINISLPSIKEQKGIAHTLSCLDEKIELNNRITKTLEEMAQAIFKSWFVDFEPFQDGEFEDSELGRIPKGWRVGTIQGFVNEMKNGGTPSRKKEEYWSNPDIPWVKTGEIRNSLIISSEEYISVEGLNNSSAKLLPKNAVLLAMYGATAGKVGLLRFEASTNQACCAMICNTVNESIFLFLTLHANQNYIESLAVGAAQQNLSKDTISKLPILIPNEAAINELPFEGLFDAIDYNLHQNKILVDIRDSLLPKLMSGEIRVPIGEVQ